MKLLITEEQIIKLIKNIIPKKLNKPSNTEIKDSFQQQ